MEDGVDIQDNKIFKMGASSNPNAVRLAALKERKQAIEEALTLRNQELRRLCIEEAELTGIMPAEIPLEPGESLPCFRRRIGTSFQLPQNLINSINNEEESIAALELAMQVQANMAEAALGLANEPNVSKIVRRQHMAQYQQHKQQYSTLEGKLAFLKARIQMSQTSNLPYYNQQHKQKKKPRPAEQDDTLSVNVSTQQNEPFGQGVLRHSTRSYQHPYVNDSNSEQSSSGYQRLAYRNSENNLQVDSNMIQSPHEETMVSALYRLSLNGYKNYIDRKEANVGNGHTQLVQSQSNPNFFQQQYSQTSNHTLPHINRRSPQSINLQSIHFYPTLTHQQHTPIQHTQLLPDHNKYSSINSYTNSSANNQSSQMCNQSNSPNSGLKKIHYYPFHTFHGQTSYRQFSHIDQSYRTTNSHQIQPHQQYEHDIMSSGLGGYWKKFENGEMIWCNSLPNVDSTWHKDKRFGSLDRRKNKRVHKRASPSADPKCATVSSVTSYHEMVRPISVKTQEVASRSQQDNRQLIRTQSLGSVGAQTIDNAWPSDDNSSCGSDAHSINEINVAARKHKRKEWYETSLDGPAPSTPTMPRSQANLSRNPLQDDFAPKPRSPQQILKPPLEIPAESNPYPVIQELNIEMFNNNIPKNCTIVQAGQCKPYHEETKPFEMSDFYKYSTKFKRSPVKLDVENSQSTSAEFNNVAPSEAINVQISEQHEDDTASVIQKGVYQPLQPMKCQPFSQSENFSRSIGSPTSLNTSFDLDQLTSNVAENFSAEMNAWYQSHEHHANNNSNDLNSNSRSTATLV